MNVLFNILLWFQFSCVVFFNLYLLEKSVKKGDSVLYFKSQICLFHSDIAHINLWLPPKRMNSLPMFDKLQCKIISLHSLTWLAILQTYLELTSQGCSFDEIQEVLELWEFLIVLPYLVFSKCTLYSFTIVIIFDSTSIIWSK